MSDIHIQYVNSPVGELILGSYEHQLCLLDFKHRKNRTGIDNRLQKALKTAYVEKDSTVIQQTRKQLDEFFNAQRQQFDVPILMLGSDFQQQVWNALLAIPLGQTVSYLQLAKAINNKKAVRAVANANGANAIGIIIPCHRVIGSNGTLVGYAGGLEAKQHLLTLEQGLLNA